MIEILVKYQNPNLLSLYKLLFHIQTKFVVSPDTTLTLVVSKSCKITFIINLFKNY